MLEMLSWQELVFLCHVVSRLFVSVSKSQFDQIYPSAGENPSALWPHSFQSDQIGANFGSQGAQSGHSARSPPRRRAAWRVVLFLCMRATKSPDDHLGLEAVRKKRRRRRKSILLKL